MLRPKPVASQGLSQAGSNPLDDSNSGGGNVLQGNIKRKGSRLKGFHAKQAAVFAVAFVATFSVLFVSKFSTAIYDNNHGLDEEAGGFFRPPGTRRPTNVADNDIRTSKQGTGRGSSLRNLESQHQSFVLNDGNPPDMANEHYPNQVNVDSPLDKQVDKQDNEGNSENQEFRGTSLTESAADPKNDIPLSDQQVNNKLHDQKAPPNENNFGANQEAVAINEGKQNNQRVDKVNLPEGGRGQNKPEKQTILNSRKQTKSRQKKTSPQKPMATEPTGRNAYAFFLGGIPSVPDDGSEKINPAMGNGNPKHAFSVYSYRGLLYNILVSVKILRDSGSKADFIVLVHMATPFAELPSEDVQLLTRMNVRIQYVPGTPTVVNEFWTLQVEKFRILDMVEYDRVLYMDADVTPHCNLDYIMDLSLGEDPILQENFAVSVESAPTSGAFFMVTPGHGYFQKLLKFIIKQGDSISFREGPGWGRSMKKGKKGKQKEFDPWRTLKGDSDDEWTFPGAQGDQGILYMWTRFTQQKLSIANGDVVEVWANENLETKVTGNPLMEHSCLSPEEEKAVNNRMLFPSEDAVAYLSPDNVAPYRDFSQWRWTNNKPWHQELVPHTTADGQIRSSTERWFHVLRSLDKDLQMGLGLADGGKESQEGHSNLKWRVVPRKTQQNMYPAWGINPKSLVQMGLRVMDNSRSVTPWEPPALRRDGSQPSTTIDSTKLRSQCKCQISTSVDPCSLSHQSLEQWLSFRSPLLLSSQRPLCPNAARNKMHVLIPAVDELSDEAIKSSFCSVVCQDYPPEKLSIYLFSNAAETSQLFGCGEDRTVEYVPPKVYDAGAKKLFVETMLRFSQEQDKDSQKKVLPICIRPKSGISTGHAKHWALRHVEAVASANDPIIVLDQGDELGTHQAFLNINEKYIETGGWATFVSYRSHFSEDTLQRRLPFRPRKSVLIDNLGSPLSFKAHLLENLNVEDFEVDDSNRGYFFRIMELAGANRIGVLSSPITSVKRPGSEAGSSKSIQDLEASHKLELPIEVVVRLASPAMASEQILWLKEHALKRNQRISLHLLNEVPEWQHGTEQVVSKFLTSHGEGGLSKNLRMFDVKLAQVEKLGSEWSQILYVNKLHKEKPLDYVIFLGGRQYCESAILQTLLESRHPKSMAAWNGMRYDHGTGLAEFDQPTLSWEDMINGEKREQKQFTYVDGAGSIVDANLWLLENQLVPMAKHFAESSNMWLSYVMDALLGWRLERVLAPIPLDVSRVEDPRVIEKQIPQLPEGRLERLIELKKRSSKDFSSMEGEADEELLRDKFRELQALFHWNVATRRESQSVDILPYNPLTFARKRPINPVFTSEGRKSQNRAFVCVTGQFDRFEANSKLDNILKPMQKYGYEIDVALILSHSGDTAFTNEDLSAWKNLKTDSEAFFESFEDAVKLFESSNVKVLLPRNGTYGKVQNPPTHAGYLKLLGSIQSRSAEAQRERVRNHALIFDSYRRCMEYADAASTEATGNPIDPQNPYYNVFLRIREDVGLNEPLRQAVLEDVFPPPPMSVTVSDCRGWQGINDRFAIVSPDIAHVYFERPYKILSTGKHIDQKIVRNPESLLLYAYVTAKIHVLGHRELNHLNRMYKSKKGDISVNSGDKKNGCPKPKVFEYIDRQIGLHGWYL